MSPFPATLHGVPVRVFQLTEDRHACIARADGHLDYVPATSLVVVSVQAEPTPIAAPRSSWGAWCPRRLSDGAIRFDADGLNSQTVTGSSSAEGKFWWYESPGSARRDGFDSFDAAMRACERFSAERGDEQPHCAEPLGDR